MELLRTPDDRFADLPGYPFAPHYAEVDGVRIHYVDEGPREAAPVLLLHGEPSWSYLYRTMIPILADAGHRVIAPDLVGFGRSDKPAQRADHTYARHVGWMHGLVRALDLQGATLVGQDWGGLIGLRVVAADPDRFARVVAANTGLPTGEQTLSWDFARWQRASQIIPIFDAGRIVAGGCVQPLPPEVAAAYNAPFPDAGYQAGPRQLPLLVPTDPNDPASEANRAAWTVLRTWTKPFLTAFSDGDPITQGGDRLFRALVPGARGQAHVTIAGAGHFLQEDQGTELARVIVEFSAATSA